MFRWDMEYLLQLYYGLEEQAKIEKDPKKIEDIRKTIATVETIIDYWIQVFEEPQSYEQENNDSIPDFRNVMADDKEVFESYGSYTSLLYSFMDHLESLVIKPIFSLPKIEVSKHRLITVSGDFFNQFKGEIADTFGKIYRTLPTHLAFREAPENSEYTMNACAQTFPIYNSGESYFDIGLYHTAQDYISIIHEFGHGITNLINPNYLWDFERYCIAEVDTLFWELVANDFIAKELGLADDTHRIHLISLQDYAYDADLMCSKLDLHDNFRTPSSCKIKLLSKYLKNEHGYDKQQIRHTLYCYAREDMHYIISFLIAVELYMIYIVDKELAISLLLRIMKVKDMNSSEYLDFVNSLGIKPGQNLRNFVDILINKGKELGYGKRLYYRH